MEPLFSKRGQLRKGRSQDAGIMAVELAMLIPVFLALIACTVFFGTVLLKYQIACKATHDAARYLSSISIAEMKNPSTIGAHVDVAKAIIAEELGSASFGAYPPTITILCGGFACSGYGVPANVSVGIQTVAIADVLPEFSWRFYSGGPFTISASATMPFVGN